LLNTALMVLQAQRASIGLALGYSSLPALAMLSSAQMSVAFLPNPIAVKPLRLHPTSGLSLSTNHNVGKPWFLTFDICRRIISGSRFFVRVCIFTCLQHAMSNGKHYYCRFICNRRATKFHCTHRSRPGTETACPIQVKHENIRFSDKVSESNTVALLDALNFYFKIPQTISCRSSRPVQVHNLLEALSR
jgi:hypothetical protein